MFLRHKTRHKDGKTHRYWSIVENRRVSGGRTVQRHVLYLGEINEAQKTAWCQTIAAFDESSRSVRQIALFPEDRTAPALDCDVVHVRLSELRLRRPRQWGACWLAGELWNQLRLDEFWSARLPPSRQGTRWLNVLKTLVAYRLVDPGSEWRLHRQWYEQTAMGDLLGEDFALAGKDRLYRCLDRLTEHKVALFSFLQQRWKALFHVEFDVLLYDLTSAYFESEPPDGGKRRFGYSRDKRPDCVQVVIALVITPDGFPLAYEVMPGNTADKTPCVAFSSGSRRNTARLGASGSWIAEFPPRRCWRRCASQRRLSPTWSARHADGWAGWSSSFCPSRGARCARRSASSWLSRMASSMCSPAAIRAAARNRRCGGGG